MVLQVQIASPKGTPKMLSCFVVFAGLICGGPGIVMKLGITWIKSKKFLVILLGQRVFALLIVALGLF